MFTFLESYLWLLPYFRNNVINDMTIQWKSYGSMVGSWNMLIYGCSIFLMNKISNDKASSHSTLAFALYFTGLFNLMFNWGHHIYTLPTHAFIKHISYAISMTELVILGRIIYNWKSSLSTAQKHFHKQGYRFLVAADAWIFLNLFLAILMSVPAINIYTHGTHITVAHTMGTTIGINTMLLLAMCYDVLGDTCKSADTYKAMMKNGYWLANISLFIFWLALIIAGILKAAWQMSPTQVPFSSMMQQLRPFFITFFIAGIMLTTGILMTIYPLVKNQLACYFKKTSSKKEKKTYRQAPTFAIE
jgi:Nitric oxide reductase large subunit